MISATLTSILQSLDYLQTGSSSLHPPKITVHVAANGCTDETAAIARKFSRVKTTELPNLGSKWETLKMLAAQSPADWIIFVDAGTVWSERFLAQFIDALNGNVEVLAIAPSYRPLRAGKLHAALWNVEKSLKRFESLCGGPVSVHGATVAYRTDRLKRLFSDLGGTAWLNDDVVIPLSMRSEYPEGVILYPIGEVGDAGVEAGRMDLGRRKRMLLGNLQWIKGIWPLSVKNNPAAAIVAGRRMFRVFWAYWFMFIALGLGLAFHDFVLPVVAAVGVLVATSGSFRQLGGAALVSLSAPFWLMQPTERLQGAWQ